MIVFDIETGPLPTERIKQLAPAFVPTTKHPGTFDPSAVKLGLLKDQAKIDAKIEESRLKHAKAVDDFQSNLAKEEIEYWQSIVDKAALSAITGQVLAIGYRSAKGTALHGREFEPDNEKEMLVKFWGKFVDCRQSRRAIVGFNSNSFDVAFIYQRSLILSVDIPAGVFDGKWLSKTFVDLRDFWTCGNKSINGSLDSIAKAFGIASKPKDELGETIKGKDFARLYMDPAKKKQALDYLANDLEMTWEFACRVGLNRAA